MAEPSELLLRPEAAAKVLGIGRTTVFRLIASGELQSVQIGRLRRIPATACRAYVEALQQGPA